MSAGPGIAGWLAALNQTAVGVRYQGAFGGVGLLAYAVYEFSGHAQYTGLTTPAVLGTATLAGSKFNGNFNGLSFGSGGVAATFAGFTVGGNAIGGNINGQLALQPQGGATQLGYLARCEIRERPVDGGHRRRGILGTGHTCSLTGLSQRRARGLSTGASYTVAPGFTVFGEYLYGDQYQSGNNFLTGATGIGAAGRANGAEFNNNVKGQTFLIGDVVNF